MALRKSEPFIKSLLHELFADAATAAIGGDADVFDQAARRPLRAQARQDAELQAADDAARFFRDHESDVRIGIKPLLAHSR